MIYRFTEVDNLKMQLEEKDMKIAFLEDKISRRRKDIMEMRIIIHELIKIIEDNNVVADKEKLEYYKAVYPVYPSSNK